MFPVNLKGSSGGKQSEVVQAEAIRVAIKNSMISCPEDVDKTFVSPTGKLVNIVTK